MVEYSRLTRQKLFKACYKH